MKNRKSISLVLAILLMVTLNSNVMAADNEVIDNNVYKSSGDYMSYDEFAIKICSRIKQLKL